MANVGLWIHDRLQNPLKVFCACFAFALISLVFNQGFRNLISLHRDHLTIQEQITAENLKIKELDLRLKNAKDPSFIERQAMDRLDMVEEHDLVFVFSDE